MAHDTSIVPHVTNLWLFTEEVNAAGASLGMASMDPSTPVEDVAQAYYQAMLDTLNSRFNAAHRTTLPDQNRDLGYFGPIRGVNPGDAPQCLVDQLAADFNRWQIPSDNSITSAMASSFTNELVTQAGVTHFSQGFYQINAVQSILWVAGTGTFTIPEYQHPQGQLGVVYVFGALYNSQELREASPDGAGGARKG